MYKHRDLPDAVQRHVASFAGEASKRVRRGSAFLGRESSVAADAGECVCGICATSESPASKSCTIFADVGARLVARETTELCRAVCLSRSPVRLLLKLIRGLLRHIVGLVPEGHRSFVRATLRRDGKERPSGEHPYLIDAYLDLIGNDLEVDLLRDLDDDDDHDLSIPSYTPGDEIPAEQIAPSTRNAVEVALISDGDGRAFTLVVVAPGLPPRDFAIDSIRFRHERDFYFVARPLYLFIQASSRRPRSQT